MNEAKGNASNILQCGLTRSRSRSRRLRYRLHHWCVAQHNSTVMVVITLKTILNEKVGYQFCR